MAVSYTHLDVYKRQVLVSVSGKVFELIFTQIHKIQPRNMTPGTTQHLTRDLQTPEQEY